MSSIPSVSSASGNTSAPQVASAGQSTAAPHAGMPPWLRGIITTYVGSENGQASGSPRLASPKADGAASGLDDDLNTEFSAEDFNLNTIIANIALAMSDQNTQITNTQDLTLQATEVLATDTAAQGSDMEWATFATMAVGVGMGAAQIGGAAASSSTVKMIENDPEMKELGSQNFKTPTQLANTAHNELNLSKTEWDGKFTQICTKYPKLELDQVMGRPEFSPDPQNPQNPPVNARGLTQDQWNIRFKAATNSAPELASLGKYEFQTKPLPANADPQAAATNECGLTKAEWQKGYGKIADRVQMKSQTTGMLWTGGLQATAQLPNALAGTWQQKQYIAAATASTASAEQNVMSSGVTQSMSTAGDLRQAISTIISNRYNEASMRMA